MGTLYLDQKDLAVRLDGGSLALYQGEERRGSVPLKPLERVVCWGSQISIETNVFHRLADGGITLIFLSGKLGNFAGCLTGRLHQNAPVRIAQYRRSIDPAFCRSLSSALVRRKIGEQLRWIADLERLTGSKSVTYEETRRRLSDAVVSAGNAETLDGLRGVEGSAAAGYFQCMTEAFPPALGFKGREKRPPPDPVNACLSLTYTLLYRELAREASICGLDPIIGFYHQFEYGRESLAADLIEPFRPQVDEWVWRLFRDEKLTKKDFAEEKKRAGCYLTKEARKIFYESYERWMGEGLRSSLRGLCQSVSRCIQDGGDGNALFDGK